MSHSHIVIVPRLLPLLHYGLFLNQLPECSLKKKKKMRSSHRGSVETNLTRNHEVVGLIPGFALWLKDLVLL